MFQIICHEHKRTTKVELEAKIVKEMQQMGFTVLDLSI